jgi:hypothetical protein
MIQERLKIIYYIDICSRHKAIVLCHALDIQIVAECLSSCIGANVRLIYVQSRVDGSSGYLVDIVQGCCIERTLRSISIVLLRRKEQRIWPTRFESLDILQKKLTSLGRNRQVTNRLACLMLIYTDVGLD